MLGRQLATTLQNMRREHGVRSYNRVLTRVVINAGIA